jgi:TolB-like protein/DNA-binding winged helix-turn-helix (wHTH) protein/Tfp pilus assembly protein PilF
LREAGPVPETYRFAEFELDLDAQQLRLRGEPLKLERRPLDLLVMLVERRGKLVGREEIIAALWPTNVIIDFESGLNTLVRKVRNVLGDSSENPRYIETVPGRGYRFVAPVDVPAAVEPAAAPVQPAVPRGRARLAGALVLALLILGGGLVWRFAVHEPEQIRIAILPFENLTGDPKLGYLASGIAEETNLSLAQIDLPNLSVIGVVSAQALAASDMPLPRIGKELGVNFLVTSSLRLDGSRIRVTSRLIRVPDGEQIWSASFDRELTNLLGLQRELSVAIAEQIRQRLSPEVAAAIDARQTKNPAAYELYLKGRYEWMQFQPGSVPRALQYYRQAVEQDPTYALAWAGIAHVLITSTVTVEANHAAVVAPARQALEQALQYGPDLAETQLALGSFRSFLQGDFPGAEIAARRAIALDSNSAMCHMFLGLVLTQQQKYVEARAMLRRARELDPLFPLMFANSAVAALSAGELEEARELATQAIAINPEFWVGYLHLGSALYRLGDYEGSIKVYAEAEKLSGGNTARAAAGRAMALIKLGREGEARDILADLLARRADRNVPPSAIAVVYAALGETDPAFDWLEHGVAQNNIFCRDLEGDENLDPLKSDLRFQPLVARCKASLDSGQVEQSRANGFAPRPGLQQPAIVPTARNIGVESPCSAPSRTPSSGTNPYCS